MKRRPASCFEDDGLGFRALHPTNVGRRSSESREDGWAR